MDDQCAGLDQTRMGTTGLMDNDWLNKCPVFFNTKTEKFSENINDVIDFEYFDWDWEGLKNYLDFGFCVFGFTPIKHVRFTQANEVVHRTSNGLEIQRLPDPFFEAFENCDATEPKEIHDWTKKYLASKINRTSNICLPLSGGYDSRYIAAFLSDLSCSNFHSYTFGNSRKQNDSFEVVRAKVIAEKLNISHRFVRLENVLAQKNHWYELFGNSTHLHGHHQLHFYKEIIKHNQKLEFCISGLVGDAWNGKIKIDTIDRPEELINLGLTHGLAASSEFAQKKSKLNTPRDEFFEQNRDALRNNEFRIVSTIRLKMMLLRYLEVIPNALGIKTISPFTELEYVIKAFKLSKEDKQERKWQQDFFRKRDLMPEDRVLRESGRWEAQEYFFLREYKEPLNVSLLKEIYDSERLQWINRHICNTISDRLNLKLNMPFRGRRFLLPFIPKSKHKVAFSEYYTLWPLQKLIESRNEYLNSK